MFCDWYIELAKARLSGEETDAQGARQVLVHVLTGILSLLHPYAFYHRGDLSNAAWRHRGAHCGTLPLHDPALDFPEDERDLTWWFGPSRPGRLVCRPMPPAANQPVYPHRIPRTFEASSAFFTRLASASSVHVGSHFELSDAVQVLTLEARILLPVDELVDREKKLPA